ncbi:MAG: nicotinate (nicotinamide) nucleotide adenylyltransferase [Flavobacteriales bacterium TMED113]|nr:MAG: nicotinate (nicotinamide) nucleotide adenylyltransferase [Flavobacteriales bacterium TMED113]
MKIGLFFGTFDPVHLGHYKIVKNLIRSKNFNKIWVIPTPLSPFKKNNIITSFQHRKLMLNKAFSDLNNVLISDIELKLRQPNYTIETLIYLQKTYPNNKYSLIIGSDNFNKIHLWKDSKKIIKNYPIYIYPREGLSINDSVIKLNSKIKLISMDTIPISSSDIRLNISSKKALNYLKPSVKEYILSNNLYI